MLKLGGGFKGDDHDSDFNNFDDHYYDDRNLDFHDCSKQVSDSPLLSFDRLHSNAESRMATDAHRFPENHDDYDLKQNEKWRTREICLTLPSGSWTSMLEAFFTQLQWRLSQRLDKHSLTKVRQSFSHKGVDTSISYNQK